MWHVSPPRIGLNWRLKSPAPRSRINPAHPNANSQGLTLHTTRYAKAVTYST